MSARTTNNIIKALIAFLLLVTVAVIVIGYRAEDTRSIVEKSACQTDPSGAACQKAKNDSTRAASIHDICIGPRKAGIECPQGPPIKSKPKRPGGSGSQSNQQDDPTGSNQKTGQVPLDSGSGPDASRPESPSRPPSSDDPPAEPPAPAPSTPSQPTEAGVRPLVDVSPVVQPACDLVTGVLGEVIKVC